MNVNRPTHVIERRRARAPTSSASLVCARATAAHRFADRSKLASLIGCQGVADWLSSRRVHVFTPVFIVNECLPLTGLLLR